MHVSGTTNKLLLIVPFFVEVLSLEVVPIEKSVILKTEYIIRNVTNDLFIGLRLKGVKNNTKLQHHNLVHNFFTKLGVADQHTLAAVNTVSRCDKNNINNKTLSFMDILNELLQEDWINDEDNSLTNNINVLKFISNYLSGGGYENTAKKLKSHDFNEVIEDLEDELAEENMVENSDEGTIFGPSKNETFSEFWKPGTNGRRIYQGVRTHIKQFPFMASIQIFHSFQCGGSIIKSDLIITAASCLQLAYNNRFFRENPAFLSVRVGSDFYQGGGDSIEALEVYFEPSYDPKTLKHNLALIRLQRHISFKKTKRVKRIEIDRKAHSVPYNSGPLIIVGWGARTSSNILENPWTNRLSYSEQGIYHYRDCEDIYSKEYVTRTNFCAGSAAKGSGACNKDAGDPGIIAGILVGVASFGSPVCGTPDVPTVFTKVGYYAEWIDEVMEQRVPTRNKFTTTRSPYRPHTPNLAKEFHRLTTFAITPFGGTMSPVPIHKVDNSLTLLRNKKKENPDEKLEDILYSMIDDKTDSKDLRERIQHMLPQIKKYATTPVPTTKEELITTDMAHQKHTVIDRMVNEDVDVNIANIIDKLDGEPDEIEQLMFENPGEMKSEVLKPSKAPLPIDIPELAGDMDYGKSIREGMVGTGVAEAQSFDLGPIDDVITDTRPSEPKEIKPVRPRKLKKVQRDQLEPINQGDKINKLRGHKQEAHKIKKIERPIKKDKFKRVPKNLKKEKIKANKGDINTETLYADEQFHEDEFAKKNIKRQQKKEKTPISKQKPPTIQNKPLDDDGGMELDGVLNDVLGSELGANVGAFDNDGHEPIDNGFDLPEDAISVGVDAKLSISDGAGSMAEELFAGIDDTLNENPQTTKDYIPKPQLNQGKHVKYNKGSIKKQKNKNIEQYDEFDYNPATKKDDHGNKKDVTEDVLTLLYLSSEESKKGKKENNGDKEEIEEPSVKELMDFDKENDGLDVVDDLFSLPLKKDEKKTLYESLPKDKLYDLLSEAINDMTSKKRNT